MAPQFKDANGNIYEGREAMEKALEKLSDTEMLSVPNRPFSGKPIKIVLGKIPPDGDYRKPLTESELKLLRKAVPGLSIRVVDPMPELSDSRLEFFLREHFHMGDSRSSTLTWDQIFEACEKYLETQRKAKRIKNGKAKHSQKQAKTAQQVSQEPELKARFKFDKAQAFFDDQDLGLPSDGPVLILERLHESFGKVVEHKDLDKSNTASSASDALRGRIAEVKKVLKRHDVPCKIIAKRG